MEASREQSSQGVCKNGLGYTVKNNCVLLTHEPCLGGGKPGADQPGHVQQFLWTGKKHVDLGVPRSLPSGDCSQDLAS